MLKFIVDLLSQASILVALFTMLGLIFLKKSINEIISGSMKALIGFILLGSGAGVIVNSLQPFGQMIEKAFHVQGVIPNNEAIVAVALGTYGTQVSIVTVVSMIFHLMIARFTPIKFIFLTGHHIFYMAAMITVIVSVGGLSGGILLILVSSLANALAMSLSPLLTYWAMPKIVGPENHIALGHFSNITYSISALIGKLIGKGSPSTEELKIPKELSFLRDNILTIALTMSILYIGAALAAGEDFVETLSEGQQYLVFALIQGITFAAGVSIVLSGVRMVIGEIIPAFKGISEKFVPNAIPALDCPVVFPYAPNAVIIGFLCSFVGGLAGLAILYAIGGVLIIPGVVPHFFVGATAGVFGNALGGRRGCIFGSFVNGLLLAFMPVTLLPILGELGFANTTFSDGDFVGVGIIIGTIVNLFK